MQKKASSASRYDCDATGRRVFLRYDNESKLLQEGQHSNSLAQVQRYRYDSLGRLIQASDNQGRQRSLRYDSQGQPRFVGEASDADQPRQLAKSTKAALPTAAPRTRQLVDDFGRVVAT